MKQKYIKLPTLREIAANLEKTISEYTIQDISIVYNPFNGNIDIISPQYFNLSKTILSKINKDFKIVGITHYAEGMIINLNYEGSYSVGE